MYHCLRLKENQDLKKEIENYSIKNNISGVILSSVGCLKKLTVRLADGKTILEKNEQFEIVSITGTLSKNGVHIHFSVSDNKGNTFGGHLKEGCIINTTVEVVLLEIKNLKFKREYDNSTGYEELVIK
ncbi:MAG: DNA-binding protein [Bacilli bacterium]|nr:DNA-binding protein [Bacilli bacterium]MDD4407298.1 DNA-binding protein [Bacilli bacterium]